MKKIKKLLVSIMMVSLLLPSLSFAEIENKTEELKPVSQTEIAPAAPEAPVAPEPPAPPAPPEAPITGNPTVKEQPVATPDPIPETIQNPNEDKGPAPTEDDDKPKEEDVKDTETTEVENTADVENNIDSTANTGENNANYNTGDGSISTGDATSILSVLNLLNTNFVTGPDGNIIFLYKDYFQDLVGNYLIDPKSGEAYDLNGSRILNNLIVNNGKLTNNYNLSANTGENSTSYNTGDGSVKTGEANVSLNVLNFLNSNFLATESGLVAMVNVFGDWIGNLLIPSNLLPTTTGATSNQNTTIQNNAQIENNINGVVNTGGNEANYNTGSGSVSTGEAIANILTKNIINQNIIGDVVYFTFVNVLGSWNGSDLLGITGQTANNANSGTTNITNNATLKNNFNLFVNTGNNLASYNTGSGSIATGDAMAAVNLINFANLNVSGKKIVILIINVFGDWTGNIQEKAVLSGDTKNESVTGPVQVIVKKVPIKSLQNVVNKFSGIGIEKSNGEEDQGVLAAEDYNFSISDFPNLLNTEEYTPQVAAISDVVDLSYRYLFVCSLITLIIFGIVYTRIRKEKL